MKAENQNTRNRIAGKGIELCMQLRALWVGVGGVNEATAEISGSYKFVIGLVGSKIIGCLRFSHQKQLHSWLGCRQTLLDIAIA